MQRTKSQKQIASDNIEIDKESPTFVNDCRDDVCYIIPTFIKIMLYEDKVNIMRECPFQSTLFTIKETKQLIKIAESYMKEYSEEEIDKINTKIQKIGELQREISLCEMEKTITEKKQPKEGFIYFIRSESHNQVKIGKTNNVRRRIEEHQKYTPNPLKLLAKLHVSNARQAEIILHGHYDRYKCVNEWFDLPDSEIKKIIVGEYPKSIFPFLS